MQTLKKYYKSIFLFLLMGYLSLISIAAYFTDSETIINSFKAGKLDIILTEEQWNALPIEMKNNVLPNQTITKDPAIENIGNVDAYVYLNVSIPTKEIIVHDLDGSLLNDGNPMKTELFSFTANDGWILLNKTEENGVVKYVYGYNQVLAPRKKTNTLFDSVTFANAAAGQGLENQLINVVVDAFASQTGLSKSMEETWSVMNSSTLLINGKAFNATIPNETTSIVFTDVVAPKSYTLDNEKLKDISVEQDGGVVSWYDESSTTYYVSTQRKGLKVLANPDASYMFSNKFLLSSYDLTNLNTELTTDMSYMFYWSGSDTNTFNVTGLDKWNVGNVTTFAYMFYNTGLNATTFNVGNISRWNTSNVTDLSSMFYSAAQNVEIFNLDLTGWDVSNVINMANMFDSTAFSAKHFELNLTGWDVSNVKNMICTFCGSGAYATDWNIHGLPDWDVSNVTDMRYLFYMVGYNKPVLNLDLSKWNTSNVKNMRYMFYMAGYNSNEIKLNIEGWDTSKVTDMRYMFYYFGYNASYSLDISGWNVSSCKLYSNFKTGTDSIKLVTPPKFG